MTYGKGSRAVGPSSGAAPGRKIAVTSFLGETVKFVKLGLNMIRASLTAVAIAAAIGVTPAAGAYPTHQVSTTIEWVGPQQWIAFNYAYFTDRRHLVVGKVYGNGRVDLVDTVQPGDYYGADPIIGDNSYVSCRVVVDGVEVLRDEAYRGDGHDCNCLRTMS